MIIINEEGSVKVWVNTNLAANRPVIPLLNIQQKGSQQNTD